MANIKYRVVKDNFSGFEVQEKRKYWPFWIQSTSYFRGVNTFYSLESAIEFIKEKVKENSNPKSKVLYSYPEK